MPEFKNLESNSLGLVQQLEDGTIVQIGLNEAQSQMLQYFAASISQDKPLIRLPEEYNLRLMIEL